MKKVILSALTLVCLGCISSEKLIQKRPMTEVQTSLPPKDAAIYIYKSWQSNVAAATMTDLGDEFQLTLPNGNGGFRTIVRVVKEGAGSHVYHHEFLESLCSNWVWEPIKQLPPLVAK
ncbi:MAG TPA: hypothetical protein VJ570_07890 [Holophagaceae bacterium]|nr:hypothetical protein [Holophagaceae bacterium]